APGHRLRGAGTGRTYSTRRVDPMIIRLLAIIAVSSVVAACSPTGPHTAASTAATTTSASTSSALSAATSPTPAGPASTAERRTAREDLAPFLAEARRVDAGLRHAATLINPGIGHDVVRVDPATVAAVHAAAPNAAARAVPVGLAPETLRRTLRVYNDL